VLLIALLSLLLGAFTAGTKDTVPVIEAPVEAEPEIVLKTEEKVEEEQPIE